MHKYNLIYIHIPRTGGTSVRKYFNEAVTGRDHSEWSAYFKANPEMYEKYTKVSVCRHPVSRCESGYKYLKNVGNGKSDRYLSNLINEYVDFDDFVSKGLHDFLKKKVTLFLPQTWFIYNCQNELMIDKLFRFEEISELSNYLSSITGRGDYPHLNKSDFDYAVTEISKKSDRLLKTVYSRDFSLLGYSD